MSKRICLLFLSAFAVCLFLSGCVDQHPEKSTEAYTAQGNGQTGAVEAAREKVIALGEHHVLWQPHRQRHRSVKKLELNLVGVCSSSTAEIPGSLSGSSNHRNGDEPGYWRFWHR